MSLSILVAPAAFKGTFGPRQVSQAISAGVRRAVPDATVLQCPISDGGDGLLDAVLPAEALREQVEVTGPLGLSVEGVLGWLDSDTAIFESATACGIALLKPQERNPLRTTTRGVGELIWEAVDRGARTVVVGLGGSATVDGGGGAARGLGWTLRDGSGASLAEGGGALVNLATLEGGWGLEARIVALTDVTTPLVGQSGAARVFGPQKGASPAAVEQLAAGLDVLGSAFARHGRPELALVPGGGAAGGLGAGLAFFARGEAGGLGAGLAFFAGGELVPGAEWVLDRIGFDAALATADLLITGEGSFDRTSLVGKASGEVLRRGHATKKKVAIVAGSATDLVGVHVASGEGRTLDAAGIAALAERATREVLGLPTP